MKILFYQWHAFMQKGIEKAFHRLHIEYDVLFYQFDSLDAWEEDMQFTQKLEKQLKEQKYKYDYVFSVDYVPLISNICNQHHIGYLSWVYDSPIHIRDISSLKNACNTVYFFDRGQVEEYRRMGIDTAFYLPLATDADSFTEIEGTSYRTDLAFVGQLYQTDYAYMCSPLCEYHKGMLDGIMNAQQQVYGAYLLPEVLTDDFIKSVNETYEKASNGHYQIEKAELEYIMACEVTGRERYLALALLSERYNFDLYSTNTDERLTKVHYKGYADYDTQMPEIFHTSRINLNISLKTIRTGIPLRVLDILGCGGFLITNYQQEIVEYFEPGVDLVIYENMEDLVVKVDYYLKHENERMQIAKNGFCKVKKLFAFEDKIKKMFGGNMGEE